MSTSNSLGQGSDFVSKADGLEGIVGRSKALTKYVVVLPEGIDIQDYNKIPKIGVSTASSPKQAISQYLHREFPKMAKLIMFKINKLGGTHAFEYVPQEFEEPVERDQKMIYETMNIACNIAKLDGISEFMDKNQRWKYYDHARDAYEKIYGSR